MKNLLFCAAFLLSFSLTFGCGQSDQIEPVASDSSSTTLISDQTVEVGCGQCQFEMEGTGCDLAVRIDGTSYYVDGSSIDDHGDAHSEDGLCNCVRQGKVTGEIKDGRFVASTIALLPDSDTAE